MGVAALAVTPLQATSFPRVSKIDGSAGIVNSVEATRWLLGFSYTRKRLLTPHSYCSNTLVRSTRFGESNWAEHPNIVETGPRKGRPLLQPVRHMRNIKGKRCVSFKGAKTLPTTLVAPADVGMVLSLVVRLPRNSCEI
jgi:hypothetical protein